MRDAGSNWAPERQELALAQCAALVTARR